MTNDQETKCKTLSGLVLIVVGTFLAVITYAALKDGRLYMRYYTLDIQDNSFVFRGILFLAGLSSLFFIVSGFLAVYTKENHDDIEP